MEPMTFVLLLTAITDTLAYSRFALFKPPVLCDEFYKPKYCPENVNLDSLKNVEEYEDCVPSLLPLDVRNYIYGFSGRGVTYIRNIEAYKKISITPRMLRDVSRPDISTTVLGTRIATPIGLSPTAVHGLVTRDGELATVRGLTSVGGVMVMSSLSNRKIADVANEARKSENSSIPYALWMQTYLFKNRSETLGVVRSAEDAGFKAIVLTCDSPLFAPSSCDGKTVLNSLDFPNLENRKFELAKIVPNTYEDLRWLVRNTRLPVIAKGILTGEDARMALRAGARAIYVSNHGGRQLDNDEATLEALPKVLDALRYVYPPPEVYVDGGVRNGYDVYKALALGARAVFVGRPILFGLAVGGDEGVKKVLTILKEEFNETMFLAGRRNVDEIRPAHLLPTMPPAPTTIRTTLPTTVPTRPSTRNPPTRVPTNPPTVPPLLENKHRLHDRK